VAIAVLNGGGYQTGLATPEQVKEAENAGTLAYLATDGQED
jgi:hypothetical protein